MATGVGDQHGLNWSDQEIDLILADYFEMLRLERSRQPFVKLHRNEALQQLIRRTRKSIDLKHCNISAVVQRLGIKPVTGYRPLPNFQNALIEGVERYLAVRRDILDGDAPLISAVHDNHSIFLEPPPIILERPSTTPALERLVSKFDPASRDARNRALGREGEQRVLMFERDRLTQFGRTDLARKIQWISEEIGDGAGYDIKSFEIDGRERLLEIKTTNGDQTTPFWITENERAFSEERADAFRLVRLYDFSRTPRAFELMPPLESSVILRPTEYRASFQ